MQICFASVNVVVNPACLLARLQTRGHKTGVIGISGFRVNQQRC